MFNLVQALQAFLSRQLLAPGWRHRVSRFEVLLQGKPVKKGAFLTLYHTLLPRVEASRSGPQQTRWLIENAWRSPLVLKHWTAFARLLTAKQCEAPDIHPTTPHNGK